MGKVSRRGFLTGFGSGLLGLGMVRKVNASLSLAAAGKGSPSELQIVKYNALGNTGLKVSDVSCGAINFFEPNVMRYAYDLGVNYFDTAESYMGTKSESFLGEALKGVRDKVIITTKHGYDPRKPIKKAQVVERIEASLKRLQSDYVDIAFAHGAGDLSLFKNEDLRAAYDQMKKEGKVRFTGFSTHDAPKTLQQALTDDFTQVVLVIYNHLEGKAIEPLIEKVQKKGIGVVAMKTFAGGKQGSLKSFVNRKVSYSQAALKWVMSNPNVNTCIPTMSSYSHVEEYVGASGQSLDRSDLAALSDYRRLASGEYCRVSCNACLSACPDQVAVGEVLRFAMYYEDYRSERMALDHYSELASAQKPMNCAGCAAPCQSACPHGLMVKSKLLHAHEILSV